MIDIERELRDLLEHKAQEVTVAPERHRRALRRATLRRFGVAGGAMVAAAALVLGLVAGAGLLDAPQAVPVPANRPPVTEDLSVDDFWVDSTMGNGPVVATGTFRDTRWRLAVDEFQFRKQPKRLSMDFTVETYNSSGGTQDFVNEDRPLGAHRGPVEEENVDYVFGWAPADVDVRLLFADGRSISPELFPGPRKIAPDLSFFVAFVPADAEVEVISSTFGHGVKIPDVESEPDTEPTGEETVISSGVNNGEEWSFVALDSEAGPCVEFRHPGGATGRCYSSDDLTSKGLKLDAMFEPTLRSTAIVGLVSEDIETVEIKLAGGATVDADLQPVRFGDGSAASLAVALFNGKQDGTVRLINKEGDPVASKSFSPLGLGRPPTPIPDKKPPRSPKELKP